jgi:hypothetical protein
LTRSSGIEFHTLNENTKLPIINILHELGHLLDSVPATNDAFSRQIEGIPEWVNDKGFVNRDILLRRFNQPVQALPDEAFDRDEYWADAFANYAADNIDLLDPIGQKMYEFVKLALKKYIYP